MDKFATRPEQERRDILQEVASRRDLSEIILEKDFWVCWTLKILFSNPALSPFLTFKGGTSLSKAYGVIERFSEDIDLTINRQAHFLAEGSDPMADDISSNERARRIETLKQNAQLFVRRVALPALQNDIQAVFGKIAGWLVVLDSDDPDRQTILFHYPKTFDVDLSGYIKPHIKLEFGARGQIEPHEPRTIISYVAETFPEFFDAPSFDVSVLAVERTFWEKSTILHALYHGSKMRDRMSRHYYDTYMLAKNGVAEKALQNPALLEDVVRNKSLLFKDNKASYDTATLESLKLSPGADLRAILKKDYDKMAEMFMGAYPDFDTVMAGIVDLEIRINRFPESFEIISFPSI